MSLVLLLIGDTASPSNPVITVPPFGLQFKVDSASTLWRGRLTGDRRRSLPVVRNEYVRFVTGFDLTYLLGNRATLRCETLDPSDDPTVAYRALTDQEFIIALEDGTALFTGRINTTEERPIEEPNFGTIISVSAVDYSEAADVSFLDVTFGTDPVPILSVIAGNPTRIVTSTPHGIAGGKTVVIEGVATTDVGVNGTHVVTAVNATEFTIPVATAAGGGGGTVRCLEYLRSILSYIVETNLSEFGISLDPTMEQGPLIEKVTFGGSVKEALDELQKRSGWPYRFLPTKQLQMFAAGTRDAPFTLHGGNVIAGTRQTKSRTGFANRIIVNYGSNSVVDKTDVFVGDGVNRVFPLKYKPASGSSTQSPGSVFDVSANAWRHVGVYGYDTLFEWVYRASDNSLVQLSEWAGTTGWPAIPNGAQIHFRYSVQFPQKVSVQDDDSVAQRGPWTRRVDAPNIFDEDGARQFGLGVLAETVASPRKLSVTTKAGLVFPGTTIEVDLPDRLITGDEWLVVSVRVREEWDGSLVFTYELLEDNALQPGWVDFFKGLSRGGSGGSTGSYSSGPTPGTIPPPAVGGGAGTGTPGKLAAWVSNSLLGDSIVTQLGTSISIGGQVTTTGAVDVGGNLTVNNVVTSPAGLPLQIQPSEDLILEPASQYIVPLNSWSVNLGRREKKWLTLHAAELVVETLVAQNTIATIGGTLLVGPTTQLVADLAPTATTIHVKYNNLSNGDILYLSAGGQVEFMRVQSNVLGQDEFGFTYTVARNLDGSGANQWYAGDAVFNTGQVGNGFIDLYSTRGVRSATEVGPTIVGNVRGSAVYNDWSPRWAVGNLNGLYYFGTNVFGAAFGDPQKVWMSVDTAFGLRMNHGLTTKVQIDTLGNATFIGNIQAGGGTIGGWTIQSPYLFSGATSGTRVVLSADGSHAMWAGHFNVGSAPFRVTSSGALTASAATITGTVNATAGTFTGLVTLSGAGAAIVSSGVSWGAGTGIFLGWTGGAYGFRVGGTSGQRLVWDGSSLTVQAGNITIDSGGIGIGTGTAFGGNRISFGGAVMYSVDGSTISVAGQLDAGIITAASQLHSSGVAHFYTHVIIDGDIDWTPPQTTGNDQPVVYSVGNGILYRKTNGATGTINFSGGGFLTVENGIVTGGG